MNKLILIPVAFMLLLTLFAFTYTGIQFTGISSDNSNVSGITIDGEPTQVEIDNAGSYEFNIWSTAGIILILTAATAVGIVAGLSVLGSGISVLSQKMLFDSVLFGGLWACLSAATVGIVFGNQFVALLWMVLTIMYVIGIGSHMTSSDGA